MKSEHLQIKQIGKIITGKTPPTENSNNFNGVYPFITPTDIKTFNERILTATDRTISDEGKKYLIGNLLPKGAICFVSIGSTIGKMCLTNCDSYTNQQINSIICSDQFNEMYIFYLLRYFKGYFQTLGAGTGSGKGIVKKSLFEKTKIPVVLDKTHQNRIANILSRYDDLIEMNNRKIAILEEQIQELYKEWFVRFRFPGHGKIKYKECSYGRIPIDFEIFKAREVIEDYIGGGWGEEDENIDYNMQAYVIRGTDFERFKQMKIEDIPLRYHKESNLKQRILKAGDFIIEISGGTEEQPVGRICYVTKESLNALLNCAICASFCKSFAINTNIVYPLYFYYFMKTLYDFRALDRYQLQSTGISNFKFEYFLRKCEIIVPPRKLVQQFDEKVKKIMHLINYLYRENNSMRLERDLLLPRLMSGKLKV